MDFRYLKLDEDLCAVLEFMEDNIPFSKLMAVSEGLAVIAPLLWSSYYRRELS